MTSVRICAVLALGVLATFHLLRLAAAQCSGARCDAYTGSVLVLVLAVILAALAGALGSVAAAQRRKRGWRGLLVGCVVLELGIPSIGLALFRNSPDTFIVASTAVTVLVPLVGLIYSFVPLRLHDLA